MARKLKGSEANLFTDRQLARRGGLTNELLKATFKEVSDWGPYEPTETGMPNWDTLLAGDRLTAVIDIRVSTYGSELEWRQQCNDDGCRKSFAAEIDLTEDLVRKTLSAEDMSVFQSGNRFSLTVDDDEGERKVVYHLMTGADEKRLVKVVENIGGDRVTASLAQRIDEVSGVHKNDVIKWLNNLDLDALQYMVEEMDSHDCGVDTSIDLICPHCGNYMELEVPLGGREFFLPKTKKRPPVKSSSSSTHSSKRRTSKRSTSPSAG